MLIHKIIASPFFYILVLFLCFYSCKGDDSELEEIVPPIVVDETPDLKLNKDVFNFSREGRDVSFVIETTQEWTISEIPEWCIFDLTKDIGTKTVNIKCNPNPCTNKNEREAVVIIESDT